MEMLELATDLKGARAEIKRLRAELETERMRLVACSVIALANTPESAASARDMHPDYQSPSCDDVARAVSDFPPAEIRHVGSAAPDGVCPGVTAGGGGDEAVV